MCSYYVTIHDKTDQISRILLSSLAVTISPFTSVKLMVLHNVSPFGLLQAQNDTNAVRQEKCMSAWPDLSDLHLCHLAPNEAQRAKRCVLPILLG